MSSQSILLSPQIPNEKNHKDEENPLFDSSWSHLATIPPEFIWSDHEKPGLNLPELKVPHIDMKAFLSGDPQAISMACSEVHEACQKHGFFIVVNHGVDAELIAKAESLLDEFFCLPMLEKQKAHRKLGEYIGYASSFVGRFASNLPWKETLSIRYFDDQNFKTVEDYFVNTMGEDYREFGTVYQNYGEAMSKVSLGIMELLGLSLGVGPKYFREFYEGNDSVMRLNYYPPCQRPDLALGIGPHCDPTSLTLLHQDQVGGLQVFVDGQWYSVSPKEGAFVVNIGDTFTALTNGVYKSCLHRVVLNEKVVRKSLAFFLCPNGEKVVIPPKELANEEEKLRLYPDFTWPTLLEFTQKHYRVDAKTLDAFSKWLQHQETN